MVLFIDRFGRRPLLLIGAAVMSVFMGLAAFLAFVLEHQVLPEGSWKQSAVGWCLLGCVCLYMGAFALAWGGVPWVYPSEIFPMEVKEKALSTSVFSQWIANFLVAYIVPQQVEAFKVWDTFAFYAVCLLGTLVLVALLVPETKGLPLEEMGALF